MKLLVCTSEYFPYGSGIANVTYNVVEQLKKKGVECTICSPTGPDIILGSKTLIKKTGIIGLLYYWICVSFYFKDNSYDIVWLQNPFLLREKSWNCVVTMHSTYYGNYIRFSGTMSFLKIYKKIVSIIEKYCLTQMNKNTRFTVVGLLVYNELMKMGIEKERISYIPNGVDTSFFKMALNKNLLREKIGIQKEDIVLLSVGRLTQVKQPQKIIKIFWLLKKRITNLKLYIAGTGEIEDQIKEMVKSEKIQDVVFLGSIDHDNGLADLYAASDYYIMSSIYEGGMPPLTLLEAMASGLPCITSDIPSFKIVRDADCGIIINFYKMDGAADEISKYILRDNSHHAKNAHEYVIQFHEWGVICKQYLELFEQKQSS